MAPGLASADRDDRWDNDDRWDRKDRWEQRVGGDRWRRDHWRDRRHGSGYRALPRQRWGGGWYTVPRHPWYPQYRHGWHRGTSLLGGAIIGSAITGSLFDRIDCRDCVRHRDPLPTREIVGCYRIERMRDGYERRIELPASACRR